LSARAKTVAAVLAFAISWPFCARSEGITELLQGTNLAFALAPNRATLVVDLAGQLWRLPASGGGAEPLTPSGELARNPRYSPDGARIVYQRFVEGQWDLWMLDLGTAERHALTSTAADERDPEFSPDGRAIVYASNRTGHFCLWSLTVDTAVETQLTEEPGDASAPSSSELGPIAYVLDRNDRWELRALLPSGVSTLLVSSSERLSAPSWRPGGGVVIYGERAGTAGSRLRMLVLGEPEVQKSLTGPEDLFRARPAWLSAGEFLYAADGQLWRREIAAQNRRPVHLIAALAVETRAPPPDLPKLDERAPQKARGLAGLTTSPDGRRTAFTALGDLWVYERGSLRQLTDDAFVDLDPAFTPDGESIVFASERSGQLELWKIGGREGAAVQVTFGAEQPHRPTVSRDGRHVAYLEPDGVGPPTARSRSRITVTDLLHPGDASVVARELVGAERPNWGADGRTLGARVAAMPAGTTASALNFELSTSRSGVMPPAPGTDALPTKGTDAIDLQWTPPPAPDDYVIEAGRVFDGVRGEYRRHVDIHIVGGRIATIVGRGVLPSPGTVIDARDATVIPGLIDVHAHESKLVGERLGRAWLAYGVTTVREIAVDLPAAVERGEAWVKGRLPGPRLIVSPAAGADISAEALLGSGIVPIRRYPGIADGFRHSVFRQSRQLGIPVLDRGRSDAGPIDTASEQHYEIEVSPEFGSYQDTLGTMIASLTVLSPALGGLAAPRGWLDPAANGRTRDPASATLFTASERASWNAGGAAAEALPRLQQTVARFVRAGGRMAVGSDAPAVPYGLGVHLELALLTEAGLPNDQALRLATAEGALALGLERQLGTIEPGKLADLLVIDGDPLARISDTLRITIVIKGGRFIERASLLIPPEP
jgi:Tol biopolymer transport system component